VWRQRVHHCARVPNLQFQQEAHHGSQPHETPYKHPAGTGHVRVRLPTLRRIPVAAWLQGYAMDAPPAAADPGGGTGSK
jgi:hypothetical protein